MLCAAAADELAEIPMQMRSPPKIIDHTASQKQTERSSRRPFPFSIHSTICFLAERGRELSPPIWAIGVTPRVGFRDVELAAVPL